jgi:intracellular sulfur oxidation DsrE/DsrF family protein
MKNDLNSCPPVLRVLIPASTVEAASRARNNAFNLLAAAPDAEVRIVVNGDGVAAVLDNPQPELDAITLLCERTLSRLYRQVAAPLFTIPVAILAIARMQQEGWCYIRA